MITEDGRLRLVDYDGMFVPGMSGLTNVETGYRNYQHPFREGTHFGPSLDAFSVIVIACSLRILGQDPSLYHQSNADDSLLLKSSDLSECLTSTSFARLEAHEDNEVRRLARLLRWQAMQPPAETALLWQLPEQAPELPPLQPPEPVPQADPPDIMDTSAAQTEPICQDVFWSPWWRMFVSRPDWTRGIEPELLRPFREVRLRSLHVAIDPWLGPLTIIVLSTMVVALILLDSGGTGPLALPGVLVLLSFPFLLLALIALIVWTILSFLSNLLQFGLYNAGLPARGKVLTFEETLREAKISIAYDVPDESGYVSRRVTDVDLFHAELRGRTVHVGDELTVLYNPNNLHTVLYEFGQYAAKQNPPPPVVPHWSDPALDSWWRMFLANSELTSGIEPELLRPYRPELRSRHAATHIFVTFLKSVGVFLVTLALLPTGPFLFLAIYWFGLRDRRLCHAGRPARATIVRRRNRRVFLNYNVLDQKGNLRSISSSLRVDSRYRQMVSEGEELTILYDRNNPRRVIIYKLSPYSIL